MQFLKACLWLLALLALSGLLLMFCYIPAAHPAAPAVPGGALLLGPLLRGLHFWAGNFAVLAVLVHLARIVFVKTNRFYAGWAFAFAVLVGLSCFTGYLLPWDQLASWIQQLWLPYLGAQDALWAVYWTHTLVLSLLMLLFLFLYIRRTRRQFARPA